MWGKWWAAGSLMGRTKEIENPGRTRLGLPSLSKSGGHICSDRDGFPHEDYAIVFALRYKQLIFLT